MDVEITIIGAGVVGLACAAKLAERYSTVVIERRSSFGRETSSRNSEVIHAGIYYPKDSLKAKLCVPGNAMLYDYCERKDVGCKRIGKYIVAVEPDEIQTLEQTLAKARANGAANVRRVDLDRFRAEEPHVKAAAALFSPDTGIIDTHELMRSLERDAALQGADFAYNHEISGIEKIEDGYKLTAKSTHGDEFELTTKRVVNSAGLDSDTVAESAGIDVSAAGYELSYCQGRYFRIRPGKSYLANRLIYPTPPKNLTSLGVHVTIDLAGGLKLGPDVRFLENRVQDYTTPDSLRYAFWKAASRYLPELEPEDIFPDQSGIRPKLAKEGGEFRDFVIEEESDKGLPNFVNLIGIESPGLTSCLAIAEMVAEKLDK